MGRRWIPRHSSFFPESIAAERSKDGSTFARHYGGRNRRPMYVVLMSHWSWVPLTAPWPAEHTISPAQDTGFLSPQGHRQSAAGTSSDGNRSGGATATVAGGGQTGDDSLFSELAAKAAAAATTMASDDESQDGHSVHKDVIASLSMRSGASSSRAGDGAFACSVAVVSVADGLLAGLPAHHSSSIAAAAALTPPERAHAVPPSLGLPNSSRERTELDAVRLQKVSAAAPDSACGPELPGPSQTPPPGSVRGGLLLQLPTGISFCRSAPGGLRAVRSAPDLCNARAVPLTLTKGDTRVSPCTNDAATMAGPLSSSPILEKGSPPAWLVAVPTAALATAPTAGTRSSVTMSVPPTDAGAGILASFLLARFSPFRQMHLPSPLQSERLSLFFCLLCPKASLSVWAVPHLWLIVSCPLPPLQRQHSHMYSSNQKESQAGACLASRRSAGASS